MGRRTVYFYISRRKLKILAILAVIITLFVLAERNLRETIITVADAKAVNAATESINQAVSEKLVGSFDYRELIYTVQDNKGRLVLMQANTVKLNKVAADTTLAIQQNLNELGNQRFNIPLGQALGSKIFASNGPLIRMVVVPIGTAQVQIREDFTEAGINQTKHRLWLDVTTRVRVVIPLVSSDAVVHTSIPITETVIVGEVPNTYIKFKLDKNNNKNNNY